MTAYNRFTPKRIFEKLKQFARRGTALVAPSLYGEPYYTCPLCGFRGPFVMAKTRTHALCPKCGSLERHRHQKLVLDRLAKEKLIDFDNARCLQFAPDAVTPALRRYCREVVTADLSPKPGSIKLDMCAMDVADESYDIVYASHVLEHIPDDLTALKEIERVLKPGGIAILPVPAVQDHTVEYDAPDPNDDDHWRKVGYDYYQRYEKFFKTVKLYRASDFPGEFQTYVYDTIRNVRLEEETPVCVKSA